MADCRVGSFCEIAWSDLLSQLILGLWDWFVELILADSTFFYNVIRDESTRILAGHHEVVVAAMAGRIPFYPVYDVCLESVLLESEVKEYQKKDKIGSKPDKNGKRGEARKSQKQLQWIKEEKLNKMQKEGPKMQTHTSFNKERREQGLDFQFPESSKRGVLFDAEYESDSSDDQSCSDKDVLEKIVSKPLSEEEIIPIKIDQHPDNAESNLMESLRTHDSSLLISSKIDSLLEEDILIPKDLLSNHTLSFAEKESFHFDIPPFSRPLAKPPDGDT
nr:hypothetical protein [Tanacetum cinerariifolium]